MLLFDDLERAPFSSMFKRGVVQITIMKIFFSYFKGAGSPGLEISGKPLFSTKQWNVFNQDFIWYLPESDYYSLEALV